MKKKKNIKINKHLFSTLLLSSLTLVTIISYKTLNINKVVADKETYEVNYYSDEIELNSASKYNPNIIKEKEKYKKIFKEKLANKLEKISIENLEKLNERIEKIIEKTIENEKMTDEKKEKLIWQLLALKEVINIEIEVRNELMINLDELLKI